MNKLALVAAAALTAGTFGVAAIAQDNTQSRAFDSADANADGLVSWEEVQGAYPGLTQSTFQQADANGDGSLDEGEFNALAILAPELAPVTQTNKDLSSNESSIEASSSDDESIEPTPGN